MSNVAFLMLVHTAVERAAKVARHWAEGGCPVVIHVDKKSGNEFDAELRAALGDLDNVRFCKRHKVEWGTWSLVAATQSAAELALSEFPHIRHVYLSSGSCLPLRPVQELREYLAERPRTDFIESATTQDVPWTVGGLDRERFTLRFPFSWRKNRKAFDKYVRLQRKVGFKRKIPTGIVPHLGSQWWCLTRSTVEAILQDPEREKYDKYFKRVWIPDESYFQTLSRLHSQNIESRSLTLSKFDFQGKPHIFYNDHLQLLRRSDCFVARKIWPRADKLYEAFLSQQPGETRKTEPNPGKIDRVFAKAVDLRTRGRSGLVMQSRYPRKGWENGKTSANYSVFEGFSDLFEDFEDWLYKVAGGRIHGHLFSPKRAEFANDEAVYNGGMSDSAALRDYDPEGFLTSLIWNTRGERQCFQFGPGDEQKISWFMATDPNAQISVVSGAWAVPLYKEVENFSYVRREAATLQRIEAKHLEILRSSYTTARVRIWSMADFIQNPMEPLQTIVDEIAPRGRNRLTEVPKMVDLSGFGQFLQDLKNQGMHPYLMGDFPVEGDPTTSAREARRPYLVQ